MDQKEKSSQQRSVSLSWRCRILVTDRYSLLIFLLFNFIFLWQFSYLFFFFFQTASTMNYFLLIACLTLAAKKKRKIGNNERALASSRLGLSVRPVVSSWRSRNSCLFMHHSLLSFTQHEQALTRNPFHAGLKRRNEETEPIIERVSFHATVGFLRPLEGLFSL